MKIRIPKHFVITDLMSGTVNRASIKYVDDAGVQICGWDIIEQIANANNASVCWIGKFTDALVCSDCVVLDSGRIKKQVSKSRIF